MERPLLTIKKYSNGQAVADAFKAGELDLAFHLPVDSLPELRATADLTVNSVADSQSYGNWDFQAPDLDKS